MRIRIILSFIALLWITGCANKDQGGIQRVSSEDANVLSSEQSRFEKSKDPPFTAETRFAAGQLAESQGQPQMAIHQYQQAIKLEPKHQRSLFRLGVLYTQAKQYTLAIESWKQYVAATNNSANAYSNLAFCFELAGKNSEAELAYKYAIKKDLDDENSRINFGLMLAKLGRNKEATEQLSAVLTPAQVHYNLASIYEQTGRKAEARAEFERALELEPELWEAQSRLSKLE